MIYPEVVEMIWVGARPRDSTGAEYLRGSRFDLSWARIFFGTRFVPQFRRIGEFREKFRECTVYFSVPPGYVMGCFVFGLRLRAPVFRCDTHVSTEHAHARPRRTVRTVPQTSL